MVDLILPVHRRAVEISRASLLLVSFVCVALWIPIGESARGEMSRTKVVTRDAIETELRQPRHLLPLPAKRRDEGTAVGVRSAKGGGPAKDSGSPLSALSPSQSTRQVNFQTPQEEFTPTAPREPALPSAQTTDPCAALVDRPYSEFGINTAMPGGQTPDDFATECWAPINASAGPLAGMRYWGATTFAWNATCLCHRPLYFEEINLERYGYGCCESLQPAASAAHFFATIPALPYCIATDCPGDCNYTLGHYRPGSCPPWQCYRPPFTPRAALAEGGVWTGLVFLIP